VKPVTSIGTFGQRDSDGGTYVCSFTTVVSVVGAGGSAVSVPEADVVVVVDEVPLGVAVVVDEVDVVGAAAGASVVDVVVVELDVTGGSWARAARVRVDVASAIPRAMKGR